MSSPILGFGGYSVPTYGPGARTGYGVENPTDYNPYQQYNTGIGSDWFTNQDKWRSVRDKTYGGDTSGSDGWMYKGDDGQRYIIRENPGLEGMTHIDQEGADGAAGTDAMLKNSPYYNGGYSVTPLHQDNAIVGYNGIPHDMYDKDGKYIETQLPQGMGHDKFWRDAAILAAIVGTAGIAGYASVGAGATAGGTGGATLGEGALAASGNYGVAAGTAGAAGTNAAAAGAAGAGAAGSAGGASGADLSTFYNDYGSSYGGSAGTTDLGGGITMGADGSISTGTTGASGLTGTAPPANPYYTGGTAATGGGSTLSGMTGQTAFSVPGIGNVSYGDLLKLGTTLYGAYSGSQGQEQTTTSTKELPEWLQGPVYGPGGVVPQSQGLMNSQLTGFQNQGLLKTVDKRKEREKAKRGLL